MFSIWKKWYKNPQLILCGLKFDKKVQFKWFYEIFLTSSIQPMEWIITLTKDLYFFSLINWTMYRNIHFTMYFSPMCEELANWIMSIALKQDLFSTWCKTGKLYGQIHLPLTNRSPLKVLYIKLFFSLCVLQLHQVSFNSDEKQKFYIEHI